MASLRASVAENEVHQCTLTSNANAKLCMNDRSAEKILSTSFTVKQGRMAVLIPCIDFNLTRSGEDELLCCSILRQQFVRAENEYLATHTL